MARPLRARCDRADILWTKVAARMPPAALLHGSSAIAQYRAVLPPMSMLTAQCTNCVLGSHAAAVLEWHGCQCGCCCRTTGWRGGAATEVNCRGQLQKPCAAAFAAAIAAVTAALRRRRRRRTCCRRLRSRRASCARCLPPPCLPP